MGALRKGLRYFPVTAGSKFPPLLEKWHDVATDDLTQLRAWHKQWPTCNWAVSCDGLVVVDVDSHKGGDEALGAWELEHGALPPTYTVRTPRGGRHLYYRSPKPLRNGTNLLGSGVDIRAHHGYVVAPPSTVGGKYEVIRDIDIAEAPRALVEFCGQPREKAVQRDVHPEDVDPDLAVAQARAHLSTFPPAIEGSGGDLQTYRAACIVRDHGVPQARACEALAEWNALCQPPWGWLDLERKVRNAWRYAESAPGEKVALFDRVRPEKRLYSPVDVRATTVLDTNYLVKGWIDRDSMALVFGPPGAGKTFTTLHLALHVAAGKEWSGCRVRGGGVLYLGYEGGAAMPRRLYALKQEFPGLDWPAIPLRLWNIRRAMASKTARAPEGRAEFEAALKAFREELKEWPALIIIDPLRDALGGSDSDVDLVAPFLEYLRLAVEATGAAVLVVHHPGHHATDRSRGDSGIEGNMDQVIRLDPDTGHVTSRKLRDGQRGTLNYRLRVVTLGMDADGDPVTSCVYQPIDAHNGLTQPEEDFLRELISMSHNGTAEVGVLKRCIPTLQPDVRNRIVTSLRQKKALIVDHKGVIVGSGAMEMFL